MRRKGRTDIVIEHAVLVTVPVKVPKGIVRREILELNEQVRKDVSDGLHKLVHEFIHLGSC